MFLVFSWRVPIGFGFFRECPPPPPLGGFEISVGGLRLPSRFRAPALVGSFTEGAASLALCTCCVLCAVCAVASGTTLAVLW